MTETVYIDFVYVDRSLRWALKRIVEWFESKPDGDVKVVGPRERFGVTELRLTHGGQDPSLVARLEENPTNAEDRSHTLPKLPAVEMHVTAAEMTDDQGEPQLQLLLDLVRGVYDATSESIKYVYGLDPYHVEAVGEDRPVPVSKTGLADGSIDDVSWLMLFPPAMADAIGRETLAKCAAWSVTELADGGVLVVATQDPTEPNDGIYAELRDDLGLGN